MLQTRLDATDRQLEKLKIQTRLDNKRIFETETGRAILAKKLRDREEEIRGKAKLLEVIWNTVFYYCLMYAYGLENVHDDNLSLTLQLNLSEEKSNKLQAENKQLVDRWMARVGEEAEAMNEASKFS